MTILQRYEILLRWSDDDSAWLAEVPDLPGCMADGETPEEALKQAEIIINEWIEEAQRLGRPIPEPGPSIDDLNRAADLLNISQLARLTGMPVQTLTSKLKRRSHFSRVEAETVRTALRGVGIFLQAVPQVEAS